MVAIWQAPNKLWNVGLTLRLRNTGLQATCTGIASLALTGVNNVICVSNYALLRLAQTQGFMALDLSMK